MPVPGFSLATHEDWHRVGGRNHNTEPVRIPDFVRCLEAKLPVEWAPYAVVGIDRIRPPPKGVDRIYCHPLEAFEAAMEATPAGADHPRWRVFVGSLVLTPELRGPVEGDHLLAWLVNAGLPFVHASAPKEGGRTVGGLTTVQRIRHAETGEVFVQEEYAVVQKAVLSALRAAARKPAARANAASVGKHGLPT